MKYLFNMFQYFDVIKSLASAFYPLEKLINQENK